MQDDFTGVVDLLKMKAIYWEEANMGMTFTEEEIPVALVGAADEWRENLIEAAAEANELESA
jgi:elongation factor G